MSQVMKREIEAAGSPHRCTKGHRDIPLGLVLTGTKRRCSRNGVNPTGLQRVCQYRGHGHAARYAIYTLGVPLDCIKTEATLLLGHLSLHGGKTRGRAQVGTR